MKGSACHSLSDAFKNWFSVEDELERKENGGMEAPGSSSQAGCPVLSPNILCHSFTALS